MTNSKRKEAPPPLPWVPSRALALKIALSYALLGALWIFYSGWLLHYLVQDAAVAAVVENVKGWLFVGVTALLLGLALDRYFRTIRQAAQQLQDSETRLHLVGDNLPDSYVYQYTHETDGTSRFTYVSAGVERVHGLTAAEVLADANRLYVQVDPDQRACLAAAKRESAGNLTDFEMELQMRRTDGETRIVHVRSTPRRTPEGKVLWDGFGIDITGRRQAEEALDTERKQLGEEQARIEAQLRQSQKMEALGTLAGGIAHDFNNILGIITGYTEIAAAVGDEGGPMAPELQQVLKAADRARDLVQQILAFSRLGDREKKPLQVGLIVKEVTKMLRASLPSTIDIETNVVSKAIVLGDPTQIHQVLMNLCTNAAHAMQEQGGVLTVGLVEVLPGSQDLALHADLEPRPYCLLTVKDTGQGIDPAIADRIFDPFFTTKAPGVGTGLGLSVVHGIVKSHDGVIEVESFPGQGTTFRVFLPVTDTTDTAETSDAAPLPRGGERILVVDDEPLLTDVLKRRLERLGYEVVSCTDGLTALDLFNRQAAEKPFDLVITDMTMPQLTGANLAEELIRRRPGLPVFLCTGFSESIDQERARKIGIRAILMKPVVLRDLAELIRDVLDEKARPLAGGAEKNR
ncbi:MAG: response regulator [Deltaproteobacteria bacterium]|nr:response regulator [Deltaproteobacteria bacterium]